MFETITPDMIVTNALIALILTVFIARMRDQGKPRSFKNGRFDYNRENVKNVLEKFCVLYPKEVLTFHGKPFKRGMAVRITTNQHYTFEGKIIGLNQQNVLCVITPKYIIAHELSHIMGIEELTQKTDQKA